MREWRYPFGNAPEVVFIVLDSGADARGTEDVLSWVRSALPLLNWRSHVFVAGGNDGEAERFSHGLLDLAGHYLARHECANLHVHSLVRMDSAHNRQADSWNRLVAPIVPFQEQARELMSEARLHFAPILAPAPDTRVADALKAAEFFGSRMAIPSFYLPAGILDGLTQQVGAADARFFLDSDSAGPMRVLWRSHVFETMLDRVEEEDETLVCPCRGHMVVDAGEGRVFSCLLAWDESGPSLPLAAPPDGPGALPEPPGGGSCLRCMAGAALAMIENLRGNSRESEGRKVCFNLSLDLAGRGELALAAELAHAAFVISTSDEDKVAALIHEAVCLRESRKLEEADRILALAGEFTQDRGQIAYHRGKVQFAWRDYIEALDWFEEALRSGSGQVPIEDMCFEMALCHINLEEYPEARPYLDRSEGTGGHKAPIAFYRGVCDYGEGKVESALEFFRRARALGPAAEDVGRVLFYIGASLKELERYEEAAAVLREAVAVDPEDLANHNLLGFCYYKLKLHKEAVACFLRAVEIDPKSGIDWANLASNLRDLGKTQEAIAMYKKALSVDPTIGFARDNLAKLTG